MFGRFSLVISTVATTHLPVSALAFCLLTRQHGNMMPTGCFLPCCAISLRLRLFISYTSPLSNTHSLCTTPDPNSYDGSPRIPSTSSYEVASTTLSASLTSKILMFCAHFPIEVLGCSGIVAQPLHSRPTITAMRNITRQLPVSTASTGDKTIRAKGFMGRSFRLPPQGALPARRGWTLPRGIACRGAFIAFFMVDILPCFLSLDIPHGAVSGAHASTQLIIRVNFLWS